MSDQPASEHDHGHQHGHLHGCRHGHHHAHPGPGHDPRGHANDQGIRGVLRYLRWAPQMWRSEINEAVVALVDPQVGERVVDVGAGMGAGTVVAARTGADVIAVEPTPFMRRVVSVRSWFQRPRSRIRIVDGSAEHLPLDDGSADAIWAVNTMHHWIDPGLGVAEIARTLRAGGRVVLVDEDFEDPDHPEFERFSAEHHDGHHGFTMVDAGRMGDLLTEAGLSDVDASTRRLVGRPTIAITGRAPAGRESA